MARRKTEKPKRAGTGPVVRLLLLLLLVSLGWQLVRINRQVETAQAQKEELAEQVESRQAENRRPAGGHRRRRQPGEKRGDRPG